jgi:hypothetical protein
MRAIPIIARNVKLHYDEEGGQHNEPKLTFTMASSSSRWSRSVNGRSETICQKLSNVTWRQDMKTNKLTFVSLLSALFITASAFAPGFAAQNNPPPTKAPTPSPTGADCQA